MLTFKTNSVFKYSKQFCEANGKIVTETVTKQQHI